MIRCFVSLAERFITFTIQVFISGASPSYRIDSERGGAPNGMAEQGSGSILASHVEHHAVGSGFWLGQMLHAKKLLRSLKYQHAKTIVLPCCHVAVPDLIKLIN